MKRGLLITLGAIALVVVLLVWTIAGTYNRLVELDQSVDAQWAQVESVYQRRADLIPNLVETVKAAASHERETLTAVTEARARVGQVTLTSDMLDDPEAMAKFQRAQGELSSALSRLLAVSEAYPELKANENFLALQSQLEGTENRIAVERMRFNEAAKSYNVARRTFPTVIVAGMLGFDEKAFFEAEAGAERAPEVKF